MCFKSIVILSYQYLKIQYKIQTSKRLMKPVQNPTTFFFKQAENPPNLYQEQIQDFVSKLINKKSCLLCKQDYNIKDRLPRILIHCGHTFCTPCLINFYLNSRVRCPMCLKLVKHLQMIDMLPINHTIFTQLVAKDIDQCRSQGKIPQITDAGQYLFAQFQRVQKKAHQQQNPPQIDPHSGLPFCTFHSDRVQHFFCVAHQTAGCRICVQVGHTRPNCKVIDLYQIEDPQEFINTHMIQPSSDVQPSSNVQNKHFLDNSDNLEDMLNDEMQFEGDDPNI